ncbi:MAG: Gfo/Idh/MocA family oxidoreductase [Oscillospiraceae bacterium]|nr:Gfo/Idh/MocA family oxidoreductase [Oscillospiraceae bacterium]
MLNIALVGAWHVHFHGYAKNVAGRIDCKITALWDDDPARGSAAAEEFACEFVGDYGALLARPDVDAILVSSATNLHPELIIKAAKAKKHIFTEKVLAVKYADALEMKKAVDGSGVKFCISFPWRCRADFLCIKDMLEKKVLGDVTYIRMRNAHNGASGNWLPETFYDKEACGGGAMMDLGAHPMYLLNWLMGRPKSVMSAFTNVTVESVEDNAVSVLEYANGAIGVSETAFVAENNPFSLEIVGTKGSLFAGGPMSILTYKTDGDWETPELDETLPSPLDIWIDGILDGSEIPFDIDDAVALTEIMDAAYRSHEGGCKVML